MENKTWQESMVKALQEWQTNPFGSFAEIIAEEPAPLTLKEKIANIPYYCGYWMTYPFLRLAYKIWDGVEDAYLNSWDK